MVPRNSPPSADGRPAPERAGGPVVVGANWFGFRPGQQIEHPHVMSRCFIWVVQGGGVIRSGPHTFRMTTGSILTLPWHHQVAYRADDRSPFRLGTLHVVPQHRRDLPVVPRVAHLPGDPLLRDPARGGGRDDGVPLHRSTGTGSGRRVGELGAFAIERFLAEPFDEAVFRPLAEIVLVESRGWGTERAATQAPPATFQAMTTYVEENATRPVSVAEVADAGDCSPTTAERLFHRHAGCSVQSWVRQSRMRRAALLLRTSGLRVQEVAALVGYPDPLYFSRVFRATHGVPPSRYARDQLRP